MRSLIRFFQKHRMLFLFLTLEGIAIIMLFQRNYIQRIAFVKTTHQVSGYFYEKISHWRDYLYLREQNRQLLEENINLRSMLPTAFYMADTARIVFSDQGKLRQYAYLSAKVIDNTVHKQYNLMMLDRGKDEGIEEGMAVISSEGIVGVVHEVYNHFSSVLPVINRNFRVSAKFKKNNYFGSLSWDGRSYRFATLNEIPLHVPVFKGDTIVVSGFSNSFPEGIPVGIVNRVEQKDGSFYTIEVLLATDFRKLFFVTVVDDKMKKDKQYLNNQTSNMP